MTIFDTNYPDKKKKEDKLVGKTITFYKENIEFTIFCWILGIFILIGIWGTNLPTQLEIDMSKPSIEMIMLYTLPIIFFVWPIMEDFKKWFLKQRELALD